jgi:hypothetical protein
MRPDRAPTEEELNQYDATDEEVAEYKAYVERTRVALINARIPPTLDWALIMLSVCSKVLQLQGAGPEFFVSMMRTTWSAEEEDFDRSFVPRFIACTMGHTQAKAQRLRGALQQAKIPLTDDMTCMAMASLACRALSRAGVPIELFDTICRGLYTDSEAAIAQAIQTIGAKA